MAQGILPRADAEKNIQNGTPLTPDPTLITGVGTTGNIRDIKRSRKIFLSSILRISKLNRFFSFLVKYSLPKVPEIQ